VKIFLGYEILANFYINDFLQTIFTETAKMFAITDMFSGSIRKFPQRRFFPHDIYHNLLKSTIPYVNKLSLDVRSRKGNICVSLSYSLWNRRGRGHKLCAKKGRNMPVPYFPPTKENNFQAP
jgi:hypothetical protein